MWSRHDQGTVAAYMGISEIRLLQQKVWNNQILKDKVAGDLCSSYCKQTP